MGYSECTAFWFVDMNAFGVEARRADFETVDGRIVSLVQSL